MNTEELFSRRYKIKIDILNILKNVEKKITQDFGRDILLDLSKEEFKYELLMYPVHMIDEYADWQSWFLQP